MDQWNHPPSQWGRAFNVMTEKQIIDILPYSEPFLFVEKLHRFDEDEVVGQYTYRPENSFYKGHFKNNPVTPGVILTETMAQIGLVCMGIVIVSKETENIEDLKIALTSTEVDFFKAVFPGETVVVKSTKEYFRFNKLKCKVEMYNHKEELVARGKIAGMLANYE